MAPKKRRPGGRGRGEADNQVSAHEPSAGAPAEQGGDWIGQLAAELPAILTLAETATILRCSRRTAYRLADAGRIHALRATDGGSSRLLIPRDEVARYLRSLEAP